MKKSRLPLYTFLTVFLSITIVGIVAMPLGLNLLKEQYFKLQTDVNQRQAKSMAQFIEKQLLDGKSKEEIATNFQASIKGMQFDRGYVCIVDQKSTNYICHPMEQAIGMSVAKKRALYDATYDSTNLIPWEKTIQEGKSGGGLLHFKSETPNEVVYFHSLDKAGWTISSHENRERMEKELQKARTIIIIGSFLFALLLAVPTSVSVRTVNKRYEDQILLEQEKSEKLLLNILPHSIATRMKQKEEIIVDYHPQVSVLFCDIVGFTPLSAKTTPEELVNLLNQIFSEFDKLSEKYGVEKIKTIGDAYMAVCGVPEGQKDTITPLAKMALEMLSVIGSINSELAVRIGIHSGEVVAGVIGKQKFSYDLWGDTVNIAARLESHGAAGKVHCSKIVFEALKEQFDFEDNGIISLKGKGETHTYFLKEKRVAQLTVEL